MVVSQDVEKTESDDHTNHNAHQPAFGFLHILPVSCKLCDAVTSGHISFLPPPGSRYSKTALRLARKTNESEIGLRIQIVVAGLVDNSDVPFFFSLGIRKDSINLSNIQIFTVLILQAQCVFLLCSMCYHGSSQEAFDFHFLFSDTVSLIPVDFSFSNAAANEFYCGHSFQLSPTACPKLLLNPHNIMNMSTHGNDINLLHRAYNLKMHNGNMAQVIFDIMFSSTSALCKLEYFHKPVCIIYQTLSAVI
ncbi:MAG: hypothetical protein V2A34_15635 [Lentisphaerota bacterium]